MGFKERVRRAAWLLLFFVHGSAIIFTALPRTSMKPTLQPKRELPGIWQLESAFINVARINPFQNLTDSYSRFLSFHQAWTTFAPIPPFEQKLLRVVAEYESGELEVLWTAPRSITGGSPSSLRVAKFIEHAIREEHVRYLFLSHFLQRRPRAKRVVLLLERVQVANPQNPRRSSGETLFFQLTPKKKARVSKP